MKICFRQLCARKNVHKTASKESTAIGSKCHLITIAKLIRRNWVMEVDYITTQYRFHTHGRHALCCVPVFQLAKWQLPIVTYITNISGKITAKSSTKKCAVCSVRKVLYHFLGKKMVLKLQ